ncbi:hypothetical protein SAMN04488003_107100 [Loktanella fryxellensis]|uniref:Uncharacterized protein n=1 Tax=Loktanella fryxellensis TaxID=245187 RepID=A0A1H8CV55_9RHOB|nr:hypothetical protein [Loktanella fryxellensis]SEM98228.1 hypothetical protein SAMN04488003_107100 [Loktanella fryxellensis]
MNLVGLMNRLLRYAARRGLRDARLLIPSESLQTDDPHVPVRQDDGSLQLHLFSANFDDRAAADAFCAAPPGTDQPSRLTRELDGAFIDESEVEVIHGDILARLQEFLPPSEADDILLRLAGDDTLIVVTENAFHGLSYTLDDTATLTYLGPVTVAV